MTMQINRITVGEIRVPLKVPFKTALRTVHQLLGAGAPASSQGDAGISQAIEGGLVMDGPWVSLPDLPGLGITALHGLTATHSYS